MTRMSASKLLAATIVWSALSAFLALWPFELDLSCVVCLNGAEVHGGNLVLASHGLAAARPSEAFWRALADMDGLTLEVLLTPASADQTGPARIISNSCGPYGRNFTLAQDRDALVVRFRTGSHDRNGIAHQLVVPRTFVANQSAHILVSHVSGETLIDVNGVRRLETDALRVDFSTWDLDFPLLLGNEATGDRPWLGVIEGVIIRSGNDGRVIANFFAQEEAAAAHVLTSAALVYPESYFTVDLAQPFLDGQFGVVDFAQHVGMLLPIGFMVALVSVSIGSGSRRSVFISISAVFVFALSTELAQYFVVARTVSIYDFLSGVIGGAVGIAFAHIVHRRASSG